jgi:sugar phosphate permease
MMVNRGKSRVEGDLTKRRYCVIALMFCVILINYMDRVNFAVSIPAIRQDFGFSLENIGQISFAWAIVCALFNFPGGWIADRLRLRWGLFHSTRLAARVHHRNAARCRNGGMMVVRSLMGAGEAPIWSFNAKTARGWAAPSERSTAYTLAG